MDMNTYDNLIDDTASSFSKRAKDIITRFDPHKTILLFLMEMGLSTVVEKFLSEGIFDEATVEYIKCKPIYKSLSERNTLFNFVLKNDADSAIQFIQQKYPEFFKKNRFLQAKLFCIKAISIMESHGAEDAILFCRSPGCFEAWASQPSMEELRRLTALLISKDIKNHKNNFILSRNYLLLLAFEVSRAVVAFYEPDYKFNHIGDSIRFYKYVNMHFGDEKSNPEAISNVSPEDPPE